MYDKNNQILSTEHGIQSACKNNYSKIDKSKIEIKEHFNTKELAEFQKLWSNKNYDTETPWTELDYVKLDEEQK